MFVAMNRFKVATGQEAAFEQIWLGRQSHLRGVPGFVQFALLKSEPEAEYISHSTWADKDSFVAWTQSEAFAAGHRQGSLAGILEGPPQVSTYEAIIVEKA